jgi:hypothetical protein
LPVTNTNRLQSAKARYSLSEDRHHLSFQYHQASFILSTRSGVWRMLTSIGRGLMSLVLAGTLIPSGVQLNFHDLH